MEKQRAKAAERARRKIEREANPTGMSLKLSIRTQKPTRPQKKARRPRRRSDSIFGTLR